MVLVAAHGAQHIISIARRCAVQFAVHTAIGLFPCVGKKGASCVITTYAYAFLLGLLSSICVKILLVA